MGSAPVPRLSPCPAPGAALGWLSGEEIHLEAPVRRMALTMWEGGLDVSYRDEGSGSYYRCRSQVAGSFSLAEALSGLTDNGAFFAFESSLYQDLDPDTLLYRSQVEPRLPAPGPQGGQSQLTAGLHPVKQFSCSPLAQNGEQVSPLVLGHTPVQCRSA